MLHVQNRDNRGGDDVQFGFVYFSDGRRVAYTSLDGVHEDATGGWEPVTPTHIRLAVDFLRKDGVNI